MTFSNSPVSITDIPRLVDIPASALSPKYRTTNLASRLIVFIIVTLVSSVVRFQPLFELPQDLVAFYPFFIGIVGLLVSISMLYHFFADPKKTYRLREQDISYSAGLFFRKTICQPILRIQHIELSRGPIERLVGLASLQVFSAGGAAHTFQVPGLVVKDAQSIRQFILDHKDITANG